MTVKVFFFFCSNISGYVIIQFVNRTVSSHTPLHNLTSKLPQTVADPKLMSGNLQATGRKVRIFKPDLKLQSFVNGDYDELNVK